MTWPTAMLGELCEINIGRTPPRADPRFWGEGEPWLSIADMNQGRELATTKEQITDLAATTVMASPTEPGTVLFSFKLSIGKVGIASRSLYTNEAIASLPIRRPDRLLPEFLYWALRSIDFTNDTDRAAMGSTMNKSKLSRIRVPTPPIEQQRRIADILDRADALRAKRREALTHLDDLTQSIFLDMFGDPIVNDRGYSTRPLIDWIDSDRPITYGILKPGENRAGGVPYIRVLDMKDRGIATSGLRRTAPEISAQYKRSVLRAGDLLLSIRGHVGRMAMVPADADGANITQDSARLAVVADARIYVLECIRTTAVQRWMQRRVKGVAVQGINLGDIKLLPIPDVPVVDRVAFAAKAKCVETMRSSVLSQIADTNQLFASLKQRAFSGAL